MEAKKTTSPSRDREIKKDPKVLTQELERQLQDENLKVYHQLLWAEEQIARNR